MQQIFVSFAICTHHPSWRKNNNSKDTDIKQSQVMSEKMRSRTEMVTTTFVDSEEDYSDDDDSEEDWRPSASNKNVKKQKQQKAISGGITKRGRKRRGSSVTRTKNLKRKPPSEESDECSEDEPSGDDYDYNDFDMTSDTSNKKPLSLPPKKQFSDKTSSISEKNNETGDILNLLLYVKDLTSADPSTNNRLCLWRKDSNNLLQKYIRVKTASDQFLFTSSSVYSSFDDKRISDFYDVKVKSIDSDHRRVQIVNPSELKKIAKSASKINKDNNEGQNILVNKKTFVEANKTKSVKSKEKNAEQSQNDAKEYSDEEDVGEENEEEEDCLLEDDEEDIEEDDEGEDD